MDSKIILVTGGAGFIGHNLCKRLVQDKNNRVISLDNYFTGSRENHVDGVEYREGHTKDIEKHVPETPDIVYHLGEYSRTASSLDEPDVVFDLNIVGTFGVLEHWRKRKYKLVYAGSSTKFVGARKDGVEGRDLAPYNWMKAANTELLHNYGRWYNLPYAITYFYNVYGQGERAGQFDGTYGTVVETFKQCYLNNQPCLINGTGEQTRAFTHVDDTIDALMLVGEKGVADEYAISAKEIYSLLELAEMFGIKTEFKSATRSTRSSGADDTTKLEKLGWEQRHTLEDYIEQIKRVSKK
ncbi:MAG TPA: NAD-dependent epimerase/dehydratase family protein [Candidatus Kaiserbacteria bacterium]|nr:NAD-dependent epimerase/dehydratase family protein [Candidatus Kaiserbacteria bacterium]